MIIKHCHNDGKFFISFCTYEIGNIAIFLSPKNINIIEVGACWKQTPNKNVHCYLHYFLVFSQMIRNVKIV